MIDIEYDSEEGKASAPATPKGIASRPYSEIDSQPVEWLWHDRIAIGKLSLLAGQPGLGKTFCAIDIASRVSTGSSFCDGSKPPQGQVGILTAEDGAGDTIRPRLDAAGANVANAFHIDGVRGKDRTEFLSLKDHLSELEAFLESKPELRLFILDPISAFMGSGCDSHVNASVRSVLGPLCELAERRRVALLGITHLSKGQAKAINAIIGSIAFVAAARSAYLVAQDPDDENQRLFLPIKNNLASCTEDFEGSSEFDWQNGQLPILQSCNQIRVGRIAISESSDKSFIEFHRMQILWTDIESSSKLNWQNGQVPVMQS